MAVGMDMRMGMGMGMGVGWNHPTMLYYNITAVYQRKPLQFNGGDGRRGEHRE